jgi:RNA polymerase sigma factor (sigma-70 family)
LQSVNELNDHELFAAFVKERKAEYLFKEILQRYKQKIYWQIRRILINHDDADEVSQIVFIKLWQHAESFHFNSALSTFLYRIAYNESVTYLKRKNRFQSLDELLDTDGHFQNMIEYSSGFNGDELAAKLQLALLTLPEKQRMVFNYRYFEDLPYHEISEITGTTVSTLKSNYHFAVLKIKKYFDPD